MRGLWRGRVLAVLQQRLQRMLQQVVCPVAVARLHVGDLQAQGKGRGEQVRPWVGSPAPLADRPLIARLGAV